MAGRDELIKQNSEKYFDSVAKTNEEIPEPVLCYGYVLERLREEQGRNLLDIGCGTGEMLSRIQKEYGDRFTLHGLDLSSESLKKAAEKCNGSFVHGDVEHLPYEDGELDVLLCMHSFHHYPHPDQALREMWRVLKDDGRLILVENHYSTYRRLRLNLSFFIRRYPQGDIRMYSWKQLRTKVEKAGFKLDDQQLIADHSQLLDCRK